MTDRHVILDVSGHQSATIDWARIKREHSEVAGAICKVGEGDSYASAPGFEAQVDGLHAAGLLAGAYWFYHPTHPGQDDAAYMVARARKRKLELGFWVDVEVDDGVDGATLLQRVIEDMGPVAHEYADNSGIYTGDWFWGPHTIGSVAAHMERFRLWVSGYNVQAPSLPVPWKSEWLWQFTDKYVTHIGPLDASVFMGDEYEWQKWTRNDPVVVTPAPPKNYDARTRAIQAAVHAKVDGDWGEDTDTRCESIRTLRNKSAQTNRSLVMAAQRTLGIQVDGILGNVTALAWLHCVALIQQALGIKADGLWGNVTDAAYLAASPMR